jgi:hypothetical protein
MDDGELRRVMAEVEDAMRAEGCGAQRIKRVTNRLVYGQPEGPDAVVPAGQTPAWEQPLPRAIQQAEAHASELYDLYQELRSAGLPFEASNVYYASDKLDDLVKELRDAQRETAEEPASGSVTP